MNRHTFNYLESITYAYHDTKRQIKEIEEELLYESKWSDVKAGKVSVKEKVDTTAVKAAALVEDRRLKRLREQVDAVDRAYNSLIPEKQELVKLYYWDDPAPRPMNYYAEKLSLSVRTAYRWRREYIYRLAKELGEI